MRTTVTLDADTEALVQRRMSEKGVTFKVALNDAIREGLGRRGTPEVPFVTPTADLGVPAVILDRALAVAAEFEDEENLRRARSGK